MIKDFDVAAQAELEEDREVSGTLEKDQKYYFKIIVKKESNGVRIKVKSYNFAQETKSPKIKFSRPLFN